MTPPALEPLPPVSIDAVELVRVRLPLATPLTSAAGARPEREVLLVHVVGADAEGWAECVAEAAPTYSPEFVAGAELVLRDHLVPRLLAGSGPCDALGLDALVGEVRGHPMARAALELAVLDAQLRLAGQPLGTWLGATVAAVAPGAALGLHASDGDLLAEADAALAAGAARLRVKVSPGRAAAPLRALRAHVGDGVALQADANGTFSLDDPEHLAELDALDAVGLACLEQPLAPDDLAGSARLGRRLSTPICLDEPITSMGALEAAVAIGACGVLCLKPGRVGGWITARAMHDRAVAMGLPVWVGGMLETGLGRAANLAVAGLPGMSLAPDLDPRPRFVTDLCPPPGAGPDGLVPVPTSPGIGVAPDPAVVAAAETSRTVIPKQDL